MSTNLVSDFSAFDLEPIDLHPVHFDDPVHFNSELSLSPSASHLQSSLSRLLSLSLAIAIASVSLSLADRDRAIAGLLSLANRDQWSPSLSLLLLSPSIEEKKRKVEEKCRSLFAAVGRTMEKIAIAIAVTVVLCSRAENVSNFIQADPIFGPDAQLVYKTYDTLYFVFIFDSAENELAMLDLMQVFVETLDKCFSNVCELDIVFNFNKVGLALFSLSKFM
ncbi:hypothetical protein TEA_005883 [Camellia sinensis var. sinensis]|uniref:AP complex mu/sigma subunit domain-containing protein n=1 Tax=Camellia sinensis var. sinensis TaxID=542762 RepID=A0A4S4EKQ5_CAMSN|nr:hypothetical protein TEA_005883 [Camellia sinensis var. sinensis]